MSTNFFAYRKTDQPCPHCHGTGQEHVSSHIGKSSGGWTFSFQTADEWDLEGKSQNFKHPGISSFKGWVEYLSRPDVSIQNEYGEPVPLEDFKAMVERVKTSPRNHTTYIKASPEWKDTRHAKECFLDEEGHSFSKGDFS